MTEPFFCEKLMCYNVQIAKKLKEYEQKFDASAIQSELFQSSQELSGFTYPKLPVIRQTGEIEFLNWGLLPAWSKDPNMRKNTLNARIETINEKPAFKAVANNRCLVLIDGFYEWQWLNSSGKSKQKYLIQSRTKEPLALGAIWSTAMYQGEKMETCSIVTTAAQGIMKQIHNTKQRMPMILSESDQSKWIDKASFNSFNSSINSILGTKLNTHNTLGLI